MKKSLIVGSASLALAAMPVVGVFATTQTETITDTLEVTIETACDFLRWGEAGNSASGITDGPDWDGETNTPGNKVTGTYSATILPGTDPVLGTSHFTAYCNAPGGYTVTVVTPGLSDGNSHTIAFSGTALNTTSGEGWTLTKGSGGLVTATGAVFMQNANSTYETAPDTETATYQVYTTSATLSGTYTGNVVYSFTYDDPTVASQQQP